MENHNSFFEKKEFDSNQFQGVYYEYKGYYSQNDKDQKKIAPIVVNFSKDEIAFLWRDLNGIAHKIYSFYVAYGTMNQQRLTEKIQNYWKMPIWKSPSKVKEKIYIDKNLISIGYFSRLYEFAINKKNNDDQFQRCKLFQRESDSKLLEILEDKKIVFPSIEDDIDVWTIDENSNVTSEHYNFRLIFCDFVYELKNNNTFDDDNYLKLLPALQDNKLIHALSKKGTYLIELHKTHFRQKDYDSEENLPQKFKNIEKEWLECCYYEKYRELFIHKNSIFKTGEIEAIFTLYKSRIGDSEKNRSKYFTVDDSDLRNDSAHFFLKQYSLYNAYRAVSNWPVYIFIIPMILIPLGDYMLYTFNQSYGYGSQFIGVFSLVIPFLYFILLIVHYDLYKINLFKLFLPKLFFGILIGWSVFWGTSDLWRTTIAANIERVVLLDSVIFVLIFLYIFTEVRSKVVRVSEQVIIQRTAVIIFIATIFSFTQGFYVIQFKAKPMFDTTGILDSIDKSQVNSIDTVLNDEELKEYPNVYTSFQNNDQKLNFFNIIKFNNYTKIEVSFIENFCLRYIWSIHLSQIMISILIGVVLQLLWEDRPITEPL